MKSLQEILQELVNHCTLITGDDVHLKLHLPPSVLGEYSRSMQPIPKFTLFGESNDSKMKVTKLHLYNGTVELES
jgi:hypothetical protein